jgi:hypothetical protein
MKVFSINADNQVAVFSSEQQVPDEPAAGQFRSVEELAKLAQNWSTARLLDIWNGLPGAQPVRKFTDRNTAVRRIWKALTCLGASVAKRAHTVASKRRGSARRAGKTKARTTGRQGSKTEQIIALLRQPSGATLGAIVAATKWQAHSVRGFISGQLGKKMGLRVESFQRDGERVYAIRG